MTRATIELQTGGKYTVDSAGWYGSDSLWVRVLTETCLPRNFYCGNAVSRAAHQAVEKYGGRVVQIEEVNDHSKAI